MKNNTNSITTADINNNPTEFAKPLMHLPDGPKEVTDAERAELAALGYTADQIKEINVKRLKPSTASVMRKGEVIDAMLHQHAADMIKAAGGRRLFPAKVIGPCLVAYGLPGGYVGMNGFGDRLHGRSLKLPKCKIGSITYYDLGCLGMTAQEKAMRKQDLDRFGRDVLKLIAVHSVDELKLPAIPTDGSSVGTVAVGEETSKISAAESVAE